MKICAEWINVLDLWLESLFKKYFINILQRGWAEKGSRQKTCAISISFLVEHFACLFLLLFFLFRIFFHRCVSLWCDVSWHLCFSAFPFRLLIVSQTIRFLCDVQFCVIVMVFVVFAIKLSILLAAAAVVVRYFDVYCFIELFQFLCAAISLA